MNLGLNRRRRLVSVVTGCFVLGIIASSAWAAPPITVTEPDCTIEDLNYMYLPQELFSESVRVSNDPIFKAKGNSILFTPDRRPSVSFPNFNGSYSSNSTGLSIRWFSEDANGDPLDIYSGFGVNGQGTGSFNGIPDAFDWLLDGLNRHYDKGFRRMMLLLPAGRLENDIHDSAQYWTMKQWRRKGFWDHIKPWIEGKAAAGDPVSMGVYAGWEIHDPCTLGMTNISEQPDMSNPQHVEWMHQNIKPWMELGFKEYWFDASSLSTLVGTSVYRYRDVAASLQYSPTWNGLIKFGGEAVPDLVPAIPNGCDKDLDFDVLAESAWAAKTVFMESRYGDEFSSPAQIPLFDPATTEVTMWLLNGGGTNCGIVDTYSTGPWLQPIDRMRLWDSLGMLYRSHGFPVRPGDYHFIQGSEMIQRIQSFGLITAQVDFNGDGLIQVDININAQDTSDFLDAWVASTTFPQVINPGYFDGDINADGVVDSFDIDDFIIARDAWLNTSTIISVDLGPPSWIP